MRTEKRGAAAPVNLTKLQMFQLRGRAYRPLMGKLTRAELRALQEHGFTDKYDDLPNVKYYQEDGKACCRVHFGPVFPCSDEDTFDYVPLNGACEVSRLCIDPDVKEVGERMRILHGLFKKVIHDCWTREVYTSAEADLRKIYTRWFGFTDAPESDPAIIEPGDADVFLLRLDLRDAKVSQRVSQLLFGSPK